MYVEIMHWDLRLSDVAKFKNIISLAQLHGQLNPPPALPFRGGIISEEHPVTLSRGLRQERILGRF
jgi:hypothetical protein